MKKKYILGLISSFVLLIMLIVAVNAWILTGVLQETPVEITTGDITSEINNVSANLYIGKDFDKNGVLDQWYESNNVVNTNLKTPSQTLVGMYSIQNKIDTSVFSNLMIAKIISYNLVIKNESNYPIEIATFFDKLDLVDNKSLVLFKIQNVNATIYDLTAYNTINNGSLTNEDYRQVPILSTKYMFDVKNCEHVFDNLLINVDEVAEIKFQIIPITYNESYTYYNNYYNSYYENIYNNKVLSHYQSYLLTYGDNADYSAVNSDLALVSTLLNETDNATLTSLLNSIITNLNTLKINEEDQTLINNLIEELEILNNIDLTSELSKFSSYLSIYSAEILGITFTINKIYVMVDFITD